MTKGLRRVLVGALVASLMMATGGCADSGTDARATTPTPPQVPRRSGSLATSPPRTDTDAPPVRYVAVSVATVWTSPGPKRPVDAPALANPAYPRQWVDDMTLAQKRWLSGTGAVQTQAIYATKVYVVATSGIWTKVAVSTQPSPKNALGYPGWVPTRQLTVKAPLRSDRVAVVRSRTAWMWSGWGPGGVGGSRIGELSYDTHLPVVTVTPTYVEVVTLLGRHRAIRRSQVALHTVGAPWNPTGAGIVGESTRFLGLDYLWGGTSGFGYDCSGLTYSLYSRAGFRLPRDASVQATRGTPVSLAGLRLGDLLFVNGSSGTVVHVVMYYGLVAGHRSVIESPSTGVSVRIVPLTTYHYVTARRYLPG